MIENQELINPELDKLDFYIRSMSMAMNSSFGMRKRCEIYFNILENVLQVSVDLFNRLNFLYFVDDTDNYITLNEIDGSGTSDYWLDFIASLFGLSRYIHDTKVASQEITLTNAELLIYIEATIARYNFDGSRESINEAYNGTSILFYPGYSIGAGSPYSEAEKAILQSRYKSSFLSQLGIAYQTKPGLVCIIHMPTNSTVCGYSTPNLTNLFNAGYLTIESVGILYSRSVVDIYESGTYGSSYYDFHDDIVDGRLQRTVYKYALPIYGVSWTNDESTTMTRTDNAVGMSDPYFMVFEEIYHAAVCFSDFDDVFPWNEAQVETIEGNKMLHMPEMWFRITVDSTDATNPKITGVAVSKEKGPALENSKWYKVDEFWYGCYGGSISDGKLKSVSGVAREVGYTRLEFDEYAKANNSDPDVIEWHQLDLYHHTVMMFLWMIEFARKDANNIFNGNFRGVIEGAGLDPVMELCETGTTDILGSQLSAQTGYRTVRNQMLWHHIEDFVGNAMEIIDGVIFAGTAQRSYATADPSKFSDFSSDMNQLSYHNPSLSGTIRSFGWDDSNPFLVIPNSSYEGFTTTAFCNIAGYVEGHIAKVGATFSANNTYYGVFAIRSQATNIRNNSTGARLMKRKVN